MMKFSTNHLNCELRSEINHRFTMAFKNFMPSKNTALFIVCFALAFWLSSYKMPLNSLTQAIVDWSYSHFRGLTTDTYESESNTVTFTALLLVLLV